MGMTALDPNPFHATNGAATGIHLSFHDISVVVRRGAANRAILHAVSGQVAPGKLLAIMGPSGSGKTTLLNILAQRSAPGVITGRVCVNGVAPPPNGSFSRLCGFATADAPFLESLTVRETLMYCGRLRLPGSFTRRAIAARVDDVISQLDLAKCAHTLVGNPTVSGSISTGERRRLTLGCELLYSPPLIVLDEVTSGLDSASAMRIMTVLQHQARQLGRTVVVTIHQPRSNIAAMFDSLLVLAEGRTVYFGPTWEVGGAALDDGAPNLLTYFRALGYPLAAYSNPADEIMDLVHSEDEEALNLNGGEGDTFNGRGDGAAAGGSGGDSWRSFLRRLGGGGHNVDASPPSVTATLLLRGDAATAASAGSASYGTKGVAATTNGGSGTPITPIAVTIVTSGPLNGKAGSVSLRPPPGAPREDVVHYLASAYAASALAVQAATLPSVFPRTPQPLFCEPPSSPSMPRRLLRCRASSDPVGGVRLSRYPTSWLNQASVVAERSWWYKLRNPDAVMSQFVGSIVLAAVIGSVYYHMALDSAGVRDRVAAIAFIVLTQVGQCDWLNAIAGSDRPPPLSNLFTFSLSLSLSPVLHVL